MLARILLVPACFVLILGAGNSREKTKSADEQVREMISKYRSLPEKAQLGKEGADIIKQLRGLRGNLSPRSQEAIARLEAYHNLRQISLAIHNYDDKQPWFDPKMFPHILPYIEQVPRLKWEYRVMPELDIRKLGKDDFAAGLNKLGDDSWELVGFEKDRFIFKRRK